MIFAFCFSVQKRELEAVATGNRTKTIRLHLFDNVIQSRKGEIFLKGGGGYYFLDSVNCNWVIGIFGPMIMFRLYHIVLFNPIHCSQNYTLIFQYYKNRIQYKTANCIDISEEKFFFWRITGRYSTEFSVFPSYGLC